MEWPCIIQIPGRYRRHSPPGWGPASAPRRVRSPRQADHAPDRRAGEPTPNLRMDVKHAHGLSQALANNCLRQVGLRCGRGDQGAASAAPRLPHRSRSQGDHTAARTEPPAKGWIDPDAGVGQDHHVTPDGHRPLLCRQEPRTEESGHQAVPTRAANTAGPVGQPPARRSMRRDFKAQTSVRGPARPIKGIAGNAQSMA